MKAIRIAKHGGPEELQVQEIPQPKPGAGEALVRIHNVGVNFADIYFRRGIARMPASFPFTPGIEGAGVVESVGDGVREVKTGDRVTWAGGQGSYAEYQTVKAAQLVPLPNEVSFDDGAAIILQGMTAHYLVHEFYPIERGSTVLVHAAAGGMGLLLIQWLKHLGAVSIGTVSTEEKAKVARDAGADHVIIYTAQDFAEEAKKITGGAGVDYIIDGVGKTTFTKNFDALKTRGWAVMFGQASGPPDPISPMTLFPKSLTVSGGSLFNYTLTRDELLGRAQGVFQGLREGWLKLRIDKEFPLAQAPEAHRLLENRQTTGKLVLRTGS